MEYKQYEDYLLLEINLHQNIAIIISAKCVKDLKCPFNKAACIASTCSIDCQVARSNDVNRCHDKYLHIILVHTLLAAFIQE